MSQDKFKKDTAAQFWGYVLALIALMAFLLLATGCNKQKQTLRRLDGNAWQIKSYSLNRDSFGITQDYNNMLCGTMIFNIDRDGSLDVLPSPIMDHSRISYFQYVVANDGKSVYITYGYDNPVSYSVKWDGRKQVSLSTEYFDKNNVLVNETLILVR